MRAEHSGFAALLSCCFAVFPASADWPQFGRGPDRVGIAAMGAADLAAPAWVAAADEDGNAIEFAGQAGVVVEGGRVFAVGKSAGLWRLFAFDAGTGAALWGTPVPAPVLDSWSTPAVDSAGGAVLVAAGKALTAIDAVSGAVRWTRPLQKSVVNASPLATDDLGPADRAFITDYDGLGGGGRLYCINVDPFDAGANPHEPGAIVWSIVLGGTSGNSPAYAGGVVYVASVADETGDSPGLVRAFPAGAASAPAPLWVFTNTEDSGFFGGVSVSGGAVYAASYAFAGGQFAANLVKLDAVTGALVWSAPSNRTDATPLPLPGGFVALSSGLDGFGSRPSIQLFRDDGASASLEWESALGTWKDANRNGSMDPGEYLLVGGWTHQPAAAEDGGIVLYAGAVPPGEGGAPCTDLYALDLAFAPGETGFVAGHWPGTGSTPALASGWVYTVGTGGLAAFAPPPLCQADCDASGVLDIDDFICFQTLFALGDGAADCDANGGLDIDDFICFQTLFAVGCP